MAPLRVWEIHRGAPTDPYATGSLPRFRKYRITIEETTE